MFLLLPSRIKCIIFIREKEMNMQEKHMKIIKGKWVSIIHATPVPYKIFYFIPGWDTSHVMKILWPV